MLIVNKIISVFKKFAWFKRFNAKVTSEALAKFIPATDWHFMNYGYIPEVQEAKSEMLPITVKDQQHSANMYHYLACKVQIEGQYVLEIGSGRGGEIMFLLPTD